MSIFGPLQVLLKVTDIKPGPPVKDRFYTLGEGEQQDNIEVTHIDEKTSVVIFNNHGTVQEISLAHTSADSTPAPNGGNIGRGHMDRLFRGPNAGENMPASAGYFPRQQPLNAMSPEMQAIWTAAQQLKARQEGASTAL